MRLTSSSISVDGKRARIIEHCGKRYRVFDDARTALLLIDLFSSEEGVEEVKFDIAMRLLFPDPAKVIEATGDSETLAGLLVKCAWDVAYLDIDGSHDSSGSKVIDWEADAEVIYSSVWQAYGKPFQEIAGQVSYEELCKMIGYVPSDTPLGQALYYRTAKEPERTKYNASEVKEFRKRKKFWALKDDKTDDSESSLADAFHALAKAAKHG